MLQAGHQSLRGKGSAQTVRAFLRATPVKRLDEAR
jgi:hypothetical protein